MRDPKEKQTALMKKLAQWPEFLRGSVASVCARCNRARCICEKQSSRLAYRLTYKDHDQQTHIVYVPVDQLPRIRKMISNYSGLRRLIEELIAINIEVFKKESRS